MLGDARIDGIGPGSQQCLPSTKYVNQILLNVENGSTNLLHDDATETVAYKDQRAFELLVVVSSRVVAIVCGAFRTLTSGSSRRSRRSASNLTAWPRTPTSEKFFTNDAS